MSNTAIEPASIELDVHKELTIQWYDDHTSVFPLEYLRKKCPCAGCRAEKEEEEKAETSGGASPFNILSGPVIKQVEAVDIEAVGNYAVRFEWNDRHNSGIYTFEFLREICPCEECEGSGS